jgi:exopolyphosphatase/pppGpp-phosphohydrolase
MRQWCGADAPGGAGPWQTGSVGWLRNGGKDGLLDRSPTRPEIAAAIDIGSYSVHLLVADVDEHALRARHDESAHLGLGRTIDAEGQLGSAVPGLIDTLGTFADHARRMGARAITVAGTDPLRRAADGPSVIERIRSDTGLEAASLSHE